MRISDWSSDVCSSDLICHMLGYEDLQRGLDLITDNSARTLNLGERYGLEVGRPANLLVLSAPDDYEMLRTQGHALLSVRNGEVLKIGRASCRERVCQYV